MSRRKVHLRIAKQVTGRIYTGMKALCGNKMAKQFDVSTNQDVTTCKPCLAVRSASDAGEQHG